MGVFRLLRCPSNYTPKEELLKFCQSQRESLGAAVPDLGLLWIFIDQNGKLLHDDKICLSEAPASITSHKPYGLARLPRHVETRSLRAPCPLVQTLVLRDVHLVAITV
ncbi:hypothetical protein KSP39_PZI008019 [Platanthera zijinensis]|uniref:Uncharacterized protein n=1 Tax=Platanthera zijinensis TaxID=2320716 RepID=A0AAP0BN88_9ASPA